MHEKSELKPNLIITDGKFLRAYYRYKSCMDKYLDNDLVHHSLNTPRMFRLKFSSSWVDTSDKYKYPEVISLHAYMQRIELREKSDPCFVWKIVAGI